MLLGCCDASTRASGCWRRAFSEGDARNCRDAFKVWLRGCELDDKRWGTLFHALGLLLQVLGRCAVFGRSRSTFREEKQSVTREGGQHSLRVDVANSAILSAFFWAYCKMLNFVGTALEELHVWAERCHCHPREDVAGSWERKRSAFKQAYGVATCILRSCRAFACAVGEPLEILNRLLSGANTDLFLDPSMMGVSEEERRVIMSDFAAARRQLVFIFRVKLGHWRSLPWHMFGIAHPDEEKARACMQRCLQLYEDPATRSDHWVCVVMLCPGSAGYDESVRFDAGGRRGNMPFPFIMAARLFFASVSERWIEGRHAVASKAFKKQPTVAPLRLASALCCTTSSRNSARTPFYFRILPSDASAPEMYGCVSRRLACARTQMSWRLLTRR